MVDGKGILDALIGAVSANGQQKGADSGIGDLLNQMLSGQPSQGAGQAGGQGGDIGSILGQFLGGGGTPQAGGQNAGGLGGLMGQIFGGGQPAGGQQAGAQGGLGDILGQVLGNSGAGASGGGLIDAVKNAVVNNPGMAKTIAIGAAGVLLGTSTGRGIAANAAKLGGIALVGGLAYKALKNFQSKQEAAGAPATMAAVPAPQDYEPVASSGEGALKLVRAMVGAAMADGVLDDGERQRILGRLSDGGLSQDEVDWLKRELAHPATARQLADAASSAQEAVEIYAAARIAIDPDTKPNKAFLNDLANAMTLPPALVVEIDKAVDGVKVDRAA